MWKSAPWNCARRWSNWPRSTKSWNSSAWWTRSPASTTAATLTSELHKEWKRAGREQVPLSIIMLDIDYFKRLNDTYGHMAGDRCLVELANLLQEEVHRPSDIVARFGGEEFIIVLPNTPLAGAEQLAERIRARAEAPLRGNREPSADVHPQSRYASQIPAPSSDAEDLIRRSDNALYEGKEAGRNRVIVAHELPS